MMIVNNYFEARERSKEEEGAFFRIFYEHNGGYFPFLKIIESCAAVCSRCRTN